MEPEIEVEVAWMEGSKVKVKKCRLPTGATVRDALTGISAPVRAGVGIFGEPVRQNRILQAGDRVELYDELPSDPKLARRERVRRLRLRG